MFRITSLYSDLASQFVSLTIKSGAQSEGANVCNEDTTGFYAFDIYIRHANGISTWFRVYNGYDGIGVIKHPTVFNYWYGRRIYTDNGVLKHGKAFDQSATVLNNNQEDALVVAVIGIKKFS